MTLLLTLLLGRLPIGWLQLLHNRTRLVAAVGGVTFADVLIFMQLGFMNALFETSVLTHRMFEADAIIAASDFHSLREANPVPRSRAWQAMRVEGVRDASSVYVGTLHWTDPATGDTTNFRVIGIDPDARIFRDAVLQEMVPRLRQPDTALVDRRTRDFDPRLASRIAESGSAEIEVRGRKLTLLATFAQGASFDVDGAMIVSDQTFLRLFPDRVPGAPTLILLDFEPGVDAASVAAAVNRGFPESDAVAFTAEGFAAAEQRYQARQTPIGFVFGFGVAIGLVVGLVIVYQVLATDVQDHLSEYATFKAIGYPPRFFLGIVFEEAIALAAMGFLPGLAIALALYSVAARVTALPIEMPWTRPLAVLALTAAMCAASGAIATRRLNSADPAELF